MANRSASRERRAQLTLQGRIRALAPGSVLPAMASCTTTYDRENCAPIKGDRGSKYVDTSESNEPEHDPDALVFSVPRYTWYEIERIKAIKDGRIISEVSDLHSQIEMLKAQEAAALIAAGDDPRKAVATAGFRDAEGIMRHVYIRYRRDLQKEAAIVPDIKPEILEALRVM
jgi:hypothetical protein